MFKRFMERCKQRSQEREDQMYDTMRREDVTEAASVLLDRATAVEALEIARLVVTKASTSFGGGADKKPLAQIAEAIRQLEERL